MCINTFLTLSPLAPYANNYDPAAPASPYGAGGILFYGGLIGSTFSLESQYNADEVVLGGAPVDLSDQTITNFAKDIYGRNVMRLWFTGYNVNVENQYLLIFHLRGIYNNPSAQFFVGTDLIRMEDINGEQQVALLMDVPANMSTAIVYVRLASEIYWAYLGVKGVDIFLL